MNTPTPSREAYSAQYFGQSCLLRQPGAFLWSCWMRMIPDVHAAELDLTAGTAGITIQAVGEAVGLFI